MKIFLNQIEKETGEAVTLQQLLESNDMAVPGIAVAVNNVVVRRTDWSAYKLADGMKVTVIKAVCGG